MNWIPTIGLEIHVQLNTHTKLFGSEPYGFGHEPNTDIGVVSTGQPGTLPVLNREAVRKAIQFGCAISSEIALFSKFDRKSYFYPDNPKNFQITQFDAPLLRGGFIECEVEGEVKTFQINRAHLEEDSGMLKHFSQFSGVDYNRAGVPLLEIVSEPCMHTAKEASSYAMAIKRVMHYLDASDCTMEEGSLRIDVNVSVRQAGEEKLRGKTEIKNMNSFANMESAIESEIARQIAFYTDHPGQTMPSATYRFDTERSKMVLMRTKESEGDYRYFPEPDLPPLLLTPQEIEEVRRALPEMPRAKLKRYLQELGIPPQAAQVLVASKPLADYFEAALRSAPTQGKALANWITIEFAGRLEGKNLWETEIQSEHIAELIELTQSGAITGKMAKAIADEMVLTPGKSPKLIASQNPAYSPVSDPRAIEELVQKVVAENAESVADYRAGKSRAFGYLVGQVMKLSQGRASPQEVNAALLKALENDKP